MKHHLTEQEAEAIRCVHHDFKHLGKWEAAVAMCVSVSRLNQILRSAKKKAPQLFPILNQDQYDVYQELQLGRTHIEIADATGFTVKQVGSIVAQLHKLDVCVYHRPKTVQYDPSMDSKVRRRF